jgi:hypothetical protein
VGKTSNAQRLSGPAGHCPVEAQASWPAAEEARWPEANWPAAGKARWPAVGEAHWPTAGEECWSAAGEAGWLAVGEARWPAAGEECWPAAEETRRRAGATAGGSREPQQAGLGIDHGGRQVLVCRACGRWGLTRVCVCVFFVFHRIAFL